MSKITWKPGTLLSPVPPALISCGTVKNPNVMTAAWTGIIASEPPMTYVSIRPERYSHEIISESKEFVINLTTLPLVSAADYCGVKSGRNVDKFKEMKLTALPCSAVKAPQIEESPVSIECRVKDVQHFGTHDMFLAEIVAVNIDDKYLNEEGRLTLEKAGLIAYVHGSYYTLGRNVGSFGFSVNKAKLKLAQKMATVAVEIKPSKKSVVEIAASKFGKEKRRGQSRKAGGFHFAGEGKGGKYKNFADNARNDFPAGKPKKKYGNNKKFVRNKTSTAR